MGGFSQWEIDSAQATKDLATDVSAAAKPYVQDAADFWNDAKAAMTDPQGQKADAASFWADAKQQQADKLKQSVSYSATQNQDEYAKNLHLGQQMGVSPELARDYQTELSQAAATSRMNYANFSQQNPRTTAWASDPQNAAVAGVDEIHRVGAIEQSADFIRALTPKQEFESKYVKPLEKAIFSFPLARAGIEMLKGTEQFAANVGVRFGLRENALQQAAESLSPERFGSYQKPEDVLAQQLGPLVATYPIGVAGRVLTAAGMSAEAASVATGLATGAAFTAEQSGATYTAMKQRGATEEQAWSAANKVALVNAPFQALFGFTHILPQRAALRAYTEMIASGESEAAARTAASRAAILGGVLPSVGVGGLTGAAGQVGQNWITGRPTTEDVGKAALTGAMTQAGMHLGMGFFEQMANVIAHTDQSQLKVRSPQQFKQAMQAVFDGQESLRIPVEQFETYFQSQNMDPAAVAASLGVQNYAEAKTGKTDVEVPTPDFLAKLDKEHQEALLPDIKDPATNMTFNQTVKGQQDLEEWRASGGPEKLQEMTAAAVKDVDAETAATPEYQQVKQELKKRFMEAGDTEPVAEANATLQANVHSYLARETGMKPTEVLAITNPRIRVGEAPAAGIEPGKAALYQAAIENIRSVVEASKGPGHAPQKAVIAPVEDWLIQTAKGQGFDLEGFNHVIDGSAIRHVINRHSNEKIELSRGQLAVSHSDFERIPEVIASPDAVVFGTKTKGKRDQIGYIKRLEDGTTLYLEEVRTGRNELATVSMRKYPAARDFDAIAGTLPSNARSDGGDKFIIVHHPSANKNEGTFYQSAFHGSPYHFDRFTLEHMGKGEGAQAFGHGLYFASNKAIAEYYRKGLSYQKIVQQFRDALPDNADTEEALEAADKGELSKPMADVIHALAKDDWLGFDYPAQAITAAFRELDQHDPSPELRAAVQKYGGQLYEADIPNDEHMLHWDEPLNEQPEAVSEGLKQSGLLEGADKYFEANGKTNPTGEDLHNFLIYSGYQPEEISRRLNEAGVKGTKYLDATSRAAGEGSHNYVVFDDNAIKILNTFYQAGEQQPRGWITVHPDGSVEIGKTPRGDLSTYSHEFAHAYMKVLGILSEREGASDVIKKDYATVLDFLGAKAGEPLTVDQQEKWARANEQFLREGKAPNKSMRGVFQRFAVWLSSIYKKATDLGVELTPEIREFLGRFYAGEEAVSKAEQESGPRQFNSPEEAGWTPEQFQKYAESRGMEADQAHAEIMSKLNAAALRDRTDAWQEEEQAVRAAKADEIDARPEYQAIRALRKGEIGDGEEAQPLTLNKDELVKQFGEARVKALQEQHRGLYRVEGGTDAQTAAEMLGYSSGEELMQALESAPRRRQTIERETRQYMTAKHGDIRYDGSLEDKARVALENDQRAERLHKELTALQGRLDALKEKVAGQKAAVRAVKIAPISAYRDAAHAMVEAKPVVDLQPMRYLDASRKYSREAFDRGLKGKVEEAAAAKHKELINHFLYREAVKAKEFISDFEAYTKRAQGKQFQQTLGKAGGDYRAQFNGLMVRYGLMQGDAQATGLAAFAQAQYDLMKEPAIDPALMDETRVLNYKHAPVSEVRAVNDALKNIRKLANQELGMIVNGRRVVFVNAIEAMAARARDVNKVTPQRVLERNRTAGEVAVNLVEQFDATLLPAERLIEMLDGGRTGPWHDFLWHLAADSQGAEEALNTEVTKAVAEAFERMPKEQRHSMFDKVSVPGIMEDATCHDLISMAFNMGNEGNLDRLRQTLEDPRIGMDPAVIDHLKNGLLSREDWQFVQDVWKVLAKVGEKSFAFEERMNGIPPVAVKPQPFTVTLRGGETMELEGGYYTVHYDPRFSHAGATQEASTTAQGLTQPGYTRATTSKGHLKERSGYGGPLLFDFEQTLTQHLTKTIKDITHREFALTANKLLMHPTVRGAIQETMGPAYEKQMLPWLRTIINDRNGSATQGLGIVSKSMRVLRKNMVLASLGFKVGTNILQILHAPRMMLYTRPSAYMQALSDYVANPREFTAQIRSMSPNEMASRGSHTDRDYREMMQEATNQQGWRARFAAAGTVTFRYIDHMLSFPLWMSVYRDALKEPTDLTESEQKYQAMQLADRAVRLGLGAHSPKDMAPIMRDNDFTKLITVLYGFHSGVYGQQRALAHELRYAGTKGIPKFTYGMLMAAIVPSILSNLVRGKKPDKDESVGHWAAMTSLMYSLETIPVLRDVVSAIERGGDVKFSPIGDVLGKGVKIAQEIKSDKPIKDYGSLGLNALDVGGTLGGIPGTAQIVKPLRYYHNVQKGKIAHPNLYDAFIGSGKTH